MRTRDRAETPPRQRGRNWLLIKHADFWSGPIDITEVAPLSVKSEGDFDDILAADMPELWITDRPATATGKGSAAALTREVIERAARKIPRPPRRGRLTATAAAAGPARARASRPAPLRGEKDPQAGGREDRGAAPRIYCSSRWASTLHTA